jgi:hypothetical protein
MPRLRASSRISSIPVVGRGAVGIMSTILTRGSSSGQGLGLGLGVDVGVGVLILAAALTFLVQILGFRGFHSRLSEGGEEEEAGEGEEDWVWVKGMEHMAMPSSPSPA